MNAYSLRSLFGQRNAVSFILLAVIAVCGLTAGTMQPTVEASVGQGRGNQLPPEFASQTAEDARKDFSDDDLKVKEQKKPRGQWDFGLGYDKEQFNDASVPVAVGAVQSLSGGGRYAGVVKIKRVEIRNRSAKAVNSVQLRWKITSLNDPSKVLLEDILPLVNFWVEANSSKVIEIPTIYPILLFNPLAKDGELNDRFDLTIGMQEARFADGSFWRRQENVAYLKVLDPYRALESRFPSLASLTPGLIPPRAGTSDEQINTSPCTLESRPTASAFCSVSNRNWRAGLVHGRARHDYRQHGWGRPESGRLL